MVITNLGEIFRDRNRIAFIFAIFSIFHATLYANLNYYGKINFSPIDRYLIDTDTNC